MTKNEKIVLLSNITTRGTIGFIVSLSLICLPIIKGNWLLYSISISVLLLTYGLLSWKDLGVIKTLEGHLLISDLIVYGVLGLITAILIYF